MTACVFVLITVVLSTPTKKAPKLRRFALVVVSGWVLVKGMIAHPVYSTSLFLPLSIIYAVIPLSHALMIIRIVQTWFTDDSLIHAPGNGHL